MVLYFEEVPAIKLFVEGGFEDRIGRSLSVLDKVLGEGKRIFLFQYFKIIITKPDTKVLGFVLEII